MCRSKMRKRVRIPTIHTFTYDEEPSGKKRKASSPIKSSQTKKRGRRKAKQNVRDFDRHIKTAFGIRQNICKCILPVKILIGKIFP